MDATRYVGIDVSAATLDIAVHEGSLTQERNDAKGIAAVVRELQPRPPRWWCSKPPERITAR